MASRQVKIAPSLLSADFARLGEDARAAVAAGADWLHVDTMDGHFVPNLTFGAIAVQALRGRVDAPVDCHLMVANPDARVPEFVEAGAHHITVHAEACTHLQRTLASIREAGCKAGVALNPHTPLSAIEHVLDDLDLVLIMTVNPGFGGQKFLRTVLPKVARAREMLDRAGSEAELEVDGGITPDTAPEARKAGASVLVAGTAVFRSEEPMRDRIARLRGSL